MHKYVCSSFHHYQWDLNYRNPVVFNEMVGSMLLLANLGVEVLRIDPRRRMAAVRWLRSSLVPSGGST